MHMEYFITCSGIKTYTVIGLVMSHLLSSTSEAWVQYQAESGKNWWCLDLSRFEGRAMKSHFVLRQRLWWDQVVHGWRRPMGEVWGAFFLRALLLAKHPGVETGRCHLAMPWAEVECTSGALGFVELFYGHFAISKDLQFFKHDFNTWHWQPVMRNSQTQECGLVAEMPVRERQTKHHKAVTYCNHTVAERIRQSAPETLKLHEFLTKLDVRAVKGSLADYLRLLRGYRRIDWWRSVAGWRSWI